MTEVKIKRLSDTAMVPKYQNDGDAGVDLHANESVTIPAAKVGLGGFTHCTAGQAIVSTGIAIALPKGYEAQIRPRSGLAAKKSITVVNSPGTIDEGYRGELKIILMNLGSEDFVINKGDRVAQMVIAPVTRASFKEVDELDETDRGEGGLGSTGV